MASFFETEELKDKLIIAGINEIDTHGPEDFSLRRVAYTCGVSCAAPYKHFKNREGLIIEILGFFNRQWKLLEDQIIQVHKDDLKTLILELCMANIKFRIANPNYRFLFTLNKETFPEEKKKEMENMNGRIEEYIRKYCEEKSYPKEVTDEIVMSINSYIYGTAMTLEPENEPMIEIEFRSIRRKIDMELREETIKGLLDEIKKESVL